MIGYGKIKEEPFMKFQFNDGGRSERYRGLAGDCFTRAVAIANDMPYNDVYTLTNEFGSRERLTKKRRKRGKSTARNGVWGETARKIMSNLGWSWNPTMLIGQGCKVHLRDGELPMGRIVCLVSRHYVAVIDGVINDTHDCSRGGTRCVYGYWSKE